MLNFYRSPVSESVIRVWYRLLAPTLQDDRRCHSARSVQCTELFNRWSVFIIRCGLQTSEQRNANMALTRDPACEGTLPAVKYDVQSPTSVSNVTAAPASRSRGPLLLPTSHIWCWAAVRKPHKTTRSYYCTRQWDTGAERRRGWTTAWKQRIRKSFRLRECLDWCGATEWLCCLVVDVIVSE